MNSVLLESLVNNRNYVMNLRRASGSASILITSIGLIISSFYSVAPTNTKAQEIAKEFNESLQWCPSIQSKSRISVEGGVGRQGFIYNVRLANGDVNAQLNAECIEAFASAAPLSKAPDWNGSLFLFTKVFSQNETPFHLSSEIGDFLAANPSLKEKCLVIHKIPPSVLKKRPGLFTEKEIFSVENCIAISFNSSAAAVSSESYANRIQAYYADWADFFSENKAATREEILEKGRSLTVQ